MKTIKTITIEAITLTLITFPVSAFAHDHGPSAAGQELTEQEEIAAHEAYQEEWDPSWEEFETYVEQAEDDHFELMPDFFEDMKGCAKASSSQIASVNSGNSKQKQFQSSCVSATGSTKWCGEVERPNPSSKGIFSCTYGAKQAHRLIHPTSSTWQNAYKAIQLIQKLQAKGICVSQIYNWWRPEPYNANVGGAAGRHPAGTSVDVRFCTTKEAVRGFDELCKYRKQGQLRALGYYGSTGVHIGVGDKTANTWGRNCK